MAESWRLHSCRSGPHCKDDEWDPEQFTQLMYCQSRQQIYNSSVVENFCWCNYVFNYNFLCLIVHKQWWIWLFKTKSCMNNDLQTVFSVHLTALSLCLQLPCTSNEASAWLVHRFIRFWGAGGNLYVCVFFFTSEFLEFSCVLSVLYFNTTRWGRSPELYENYIYYRHLSETHETYSGWILIQFLAMI